MKQYLALLPLFALCGCLSPVSAPSVACWLMEYRDAVAVAQSPKYGVGRLSQVIVNMPYADNRMVVLRHDGTVAFDDHNLFAASPASLLKGVCLAALKHSGHFSDVVGASSIAASSVSIEVSVSRLALDCRQADSRRASVELIVRLLEGKRIVAVSEGSGLADASDGDYGVAFSKAVSLAMASALSKLR